MTSRLWLPLRVIASTAAIGLVTLFWLHLAQANPTTVALSYVVVVLAIATGWGITEATIASLVAVVCLNLFFLPPVGALTIADPQNWVALVAFLLAAILASQLSGRARQRNLEALARQRDLERLYTLSRGLLLWEGRGPVQTAIARGIAEAFALPAVALYDHRLNTVALGGAAELPDIDRKLRDVARQAVRLQDDAGVVITPVTLGGAPIGSLALPGQGLSDTVLQSIANLAAIGLERVRSQDATARGEAARQSGELRAAVMDALAHDFKTPLTAGMAAAADLRSSAAIDAHDRELADIIGEELDRLQALVTDAVRMLRIDAGDFVVHRDRYPLRTLVSATLQKLAARLDGHDVVNRVAADIQIEVDRDLLDLALRQLLDNAVKYSPPTSAIAIEGTDDGAVALTVRNSGPAISDADRARIFDRFYRGAQARQIPGTGLGLAIVRQIAEAHGGTLVVTSTAEAGTAFTLSLPHGAPS